MLYGSPGPTQPSPSPSKGIGQLGLPALSTSPTLVTDGGHTDDAATLPSHVTVTVIGSASQRDPKQQTATTDQTATADDTGAHPSAMSAQSGQQQQGRGSSLGGSQLSLPLRSAPPHNDAALSQSPLNMLQVGWLVDLAWSVGWLVCSCRMCRLYLQGFGTCKQAQHVSGRADTASSCERDATHVTCMRSLRMCCRC